jgi:hypothetical protein
MVAKLVKRIGMFSQEHNLFSIFKKSWTLHAMFIYQLFDFTKGGEFLLEKKTHFTREKLCVSSLILEILKIMKIH